MSDIEEENMLTFRSGIGEISMGGFSRNANSKMITSMNNIETNSNRYRLDLTGFDTGYCGRALSPLSFRSARSTRFHPGQYTSSQRSIVNGRSGSPLSFRSVDSTRTVLDITNALKFETFNTHELQLIKEVVCRKLKLKHRKRYEKNRQRSVLFKSNRSNIVRHINCRNNSDRDSSESPLSCNEDNEPGQPPELLKETTILSGGKSLLMNSINNNSQYPNHTHQKNVFSFNQKVSENLTQVVQPDSTQACSEKPSLKDCFTNVYMFPSQRFNITTDRNSNDTPIVNQANLSSENEEIFSDSENRKRSLNQQSNNNAKRIKLGSQRNQIDVNNTINTKHNCSKDTFKMPQPKDNRIAPKERLISLSVPLTMTINKITEEPRDIPNESEESKSVEVSMKSSFSKRKLFTQKVDLLTSKELSNIAGPSPQTKVENKERNKARKLVTTQSCLDRSVSDDEDLVLDLIHKIVPAEQMKSTSSKINLTAVMPEEKLDSDVSDTFTDETLNGTVFDINCKQINTDKDNNTKLLSSNQNNRRALKCSGPANNYGSKSIHQKSNYIKSFWETDIESEMESENIPVWKIPRPIAKKDNLKDITSSALNITTQQSGKISANILTVQDLQNKIVTSKRRLNTANKVEKPNDHTTDISTCLNERNSPNVLESENNIKEMKTNKKKAQNDRTKQKSSASDTTKTKNSKANTGPRKASGKTSNTQLSNSNSSLDTSLNISSRTRSKQRNASLETSKENISQLSDGTHNSFTLKSLIPKKNNKKK